MLGFATTHEGTGDWGLGTGDWEQGGQGGQGGQTIQNSKLRLDC